MHKIAEYEALRATIRERGTVRICAVLAGVIAWAALLVALNAAEFDRAVTLVPFLVLVTTYETSFFLHTGVERIGRYLQVYYEEREGWENTVMAYGKNYPGGLDPLFVTLFAVISAVNFLGTFPNAVRHPGWVGISLVGHLIFAWRLVATRRLAASQRAVDLERFQTLKNSTPSN